MQIKVPATSANLGPGFDSIGIAVSLYLTIDVLEATDHWFIDHDLGAEVPTDETNMILSTALQLAPNLQPHAFKMVSEIPVTRGLGSSSAAIVAGIEIANQLGHLNLTDQQKVEFACQIEGHPDNVAPAIFGDLVIGTNVDDQFVAIKAQFPRLSFVAYIPDYELKTSDSRGVLPAQLDFHDAVHASSVGNTFVASLFTQDYATLGKLIEADQFHEPYRQRLVPELQQIRTIAHQTGALATYLSGAGPTVMTIIDDQAFPAFQQALIDHGLTAQTVQLSIVTDGVQILP